MKTELYFKVKQRLNAIRDAEKEIVEQLDYLEEILRNEQNKESLQEYLKQSR